MADACLNKISLGTFFRAICILVICSISCSFDASGSGFLSHQGTSFSDLGSSGLTAACSTSSF